MGGNMGHARISPMKRLLIVFMIWFPIACVFVGPQEWNQERGPVVPHDTFPGDCALCHVGNGWHKIKSDFSFDHGKETGVTLLGAHKKAECLLCHNDRGGLKASMQRGCQGCHADPHAAQLGQNCKSCHNEKSWVPRGQISKHARTRFPLAGVHASAACQRCHPGAHVGRFGGLDPSCEVCHTKELVRATNPDHQAQGWTDNCQRCHIPTAWADARFNHDSYPLVGEHRTQACSACHKNNVFKGTPNQCVDCHLSNYQATTNPQHSTAGFGTDCERCHSPYGWAGANFDHDNFFVLRGSHKGLDCSKCHKNNVYKGTPKDCASCHINDYNSTTSPNHAASGFPTTCETCHNETAWEGATFDHTAFPIDSGKHKGLSCTDCHPNLAQPKTFTCLSCHDHSKTKMDDKHKDVSGYSWTSSSCYSCHPKGKE